MPSATGTTRTDPPSAVALTAAQRNGLYAARGFIASDVEKKLGLTIPFDIYFQDPLVAEKYPDLAFDENCHVPWEPGVWDGPTSARFAVVDYDGHTATVTPAARWDAKHQVFLAPDGSALDRKNAALPQFHQVSVWAILQRALEFFEGGFGLGRRIPWGFDGNRLIVVPHAGPGENAYYDRWSKSLQFYYFDRGSERVYTCLSTDIVQHEFGHAVLDGIRPHYIETVSTETAAFHEFIGDLTAILIAFRNNAFRRFLIAETGGHLERESTLSSLAEQFGRHVEDKPYLRSARNALRMKDVAGDRRPHYMSQVLTGAMFDIIIRLSQHYVRKGRTVPEAFWHTIERMQAMAIQPLDLLPPVDVTFSDYARAVLRAEETANPTDPDNYRETMLDVFVRRGILDAADTEALRAPHHVFDRLRLDVFHDTDSLAGSRPAAYRFLDDNRHALLIPPGADLVVSDLSVAHKLTREGRRLPRQVLLQYVWPEDVRLEGARFGRFDGQTTRMLCGGTLALTENGDVLAWSRKPGTVPPAGGADEAVKEQQAGARRKEGFLDALARHVGTGRVGTALGGEIGLLEKSVHPLRARPVDGVLRFELSPHLTVHEDLDAVHGGRAWQISS